jgi:hypothetical protein
MGSQPMHASVRVSTLQQHVDAVVPWLQVEVKRLGRLGAGGLAASGPTQSAPMLAVQLPDSTHMRPHQARHESLSLKLQRVAAVQHPTPTQPRTTESRFPGTLRPVAPLGLEGSGEGAAKGALALLYSFGSRTRHGTMHAAATMPATIRP